MAIVYKSTNKINNKSYIGITIRTLNERINDHKYKTNSNSDFYFHRALRKYGFDNFSWEIIENCSDDILEEREKFYINEFNTYAPLNNGYNMTIGGLYNFGSKGDCYWLNRLSGDDKKEWLKKHRIGENNGMYNNGHLLSGDNHFLNKMTTEQKEQWLDTNLKGENNYQKKLSKQELKNKCWINNISDDRKNEYILNNLKGENNPMYKNARIYVITFPNGNEFFSKLSYFCKTYTFEKMNTVGFYYVVNGKYKHYKKFKCRLYNDIKDKNIKEWKKEYGY